LTLCRKEKEEKKKMGKALRALLRILGVLITTTVALAQTAPPQAVAAGYTKLTFDEEFSSYSGIDVGNTMQAGYNFYSIQPFRLLISTFRMGP
jgi:hypothetical protein